MKDDESEKDEESKDEKKKDEMSEKKDSGKRKTSEGDRKDYKKPKVEQKRYNNNVKSDYSKLPETSDHDEIRKQVEFYFSDSNLYQDKHLMNEVGGSENKPVPVKHIHSFKRMQRFQPYSAVVAALKESEVLDIVGAAGVEEIQRKVALEPRGEKTEREYIQEFEDRTIPRSIYAKGFGDEEPSTQIDVEEFFEPYGPIRSIRLRRTYPDKVFKGSVFVEFEDEETQQQFLELDPKPKWQDKELLIKSKRQYCDEKKEDIAAGKIKPSGFKPFRDGGGYRGRGDRYHGDRRSGRGGKFDHRDKGRGRDRDEDDWKGRRTDFQRGDNDGFSRDGRGNGRGPRTCYNCGEEGHKKSDCPSLTKYDDKDTKSVCPDYLLVLAFQH